MSANRFRIVLLLLVLILLVVSALFGVLTYWLGDEVSSSSPPVQRGSELTVGPLCCVVLRGRALSYSVAQAAQGIGGEA